VKTVEEVQTILETGTGTEAGIHRTMALVDCARRVRLNDALPFQFSFSRDVGTIFHYMAAEYHEGRDHGIPAPGPHNEDTWWPHSPLTAAVTEAWRLYEFYTGFVMPDAFGKVIGAEVHLDGTLPNGYRKTGQADLIVEHEGGYIFDNVHLDEGIWIVDHKTSGQKNRHWHMIYEYSLQPKLYSYLYEQQTGTPVQGVLINQLVRHKNLSKENSHVIFTADSYDDDDIKRLCALEEFAMKLEKEDRAVVSHCVDNWGPCPHLVSGECTRL
jgi:hypothetical protein